MPMNRHPLFTVTLCFPALALAACGAREEATVDSSTTLAASTSPQFVVEAGLSTPESVLWDPSRSVWYVSNINGNPPQKDDNGYIVRLGADGATLDSLPFVNGTDADITLHAPKGMALSGDTLWVADIDALRGFSVSSGTELANISLEALGATFLNDVAVGPDGAVYITDSGIAFDDTGAVTHPGQSRVFVVRNGTPTEAVVLPRESAANGIAWNASTKAWMIVGFNSPNIFEWKPGAAEVTVLGTGPGGGDGLVLLEDGRAVYSSWADSTVNVFANGVSTTLRTGLPSPADLGYDPARKLLAVPLFSDNRVEFWALGN